MQSHFNATKDIHLLNDYALVASIEKNVQLKFLLLHFFGK